MQKQIKSDTNHMPKLVISLSEIRDNLANQYGLPVESVEITPYPRDNHLFTPDQIAAELDSIIREAR